MNKTENISSQQELLEVKKQLPVEIYQCIESTKEIGAKISRTGGTLDFGNIIQFIDHILDTKPVEFTNGEVQNAAGENTGSLKILAFGKMMGLHTQQILGMFGEHYKDVRNDPEGESHQNIRALQKTGIEGVIMSENPFSLRNTNPYNLTPKEIEVLGYLARGYINKQIAHRLSISVRTIEIHRSNIRRKTQCNTVAEFQEVKKKTSGKVINNQLTEEQKQESHNLSPKEREILGYIANGYVNQQIAHRLGISVRTIETHRLNLRRKTKSSSRSDLVEIAKDLQLID